MLATAATVIYSEDFIQLQEAGETRAIFTCLSSYYLRENSFLSAPSEDLQLQLWTELGHMPTCGRKMLGTINSPLPPSATCHSPRVRGSLPCPHPRETKPRWGQGHSEVGLGPAETAALGVVLLWSWGRAGLLRFPLRPVWVTQTSFLLF